MKNKITTITTVEQFITVVKENKNRRLLYRGENRKYNILQASAFRDTQYPFIKMKEEFKREVWSELSMDVRNDFLAFCQHHGLPTNLLDFTYNPLIALYFSCKGDLKDKGYVYLVNPEFMDITPIVSYIGDNNLLEKLSENDEDFLKSYVMLVNDFRNEYRQFFKRTFENLKNEIVDILVKNTDNFQKLENDDLKSYIQGDLEKRVMDYNKGMNEIMSVVLDFEYPDRSYNESLSYLLYLRYFISLIRQYNKGVNSFEGSIPMIYRPIMPFKRGLNQKGLFIYQSFISCEDEKNHTHNLAIQKLLFDSMIEVENKEEILKTLDLIGINDKFVYADFDSIARYIKDKYKWFLPKI